MQEQQNGELRGEVNKSFSLQGSKEKLTSSHSSLLPTQEKALKTTVILRAVTDAEFISC